MFSVIELSVIKMVFTLQQNRHIYCTMRIDTMACEILKELNKKLFLMPSSDFAEIHDCPY